MYQTDKTIDEICSRQPGLIMKSANDCHRYYNCSGEDFELSNWVEMYKFWPSKYKHECHYPLMYSEETMQCESYSEVECGTRYKPIWECKYTIILISTLTIHYTMFSVIKNYLIIDDALAFIWRSCPKTKTKIKTRIRMR